jgi:hypothetical protein
MYGIFSDLLAGKICRRRSIVVIIYAVSRAFPGQREIETPLWRRMATAALWKVFFRKMFKKYILLNIIYLKPN